MSSLKEAIFFALDLYQFYFTSFFSMFFLCGKIIFQYQLHLLVFYYEIIEYLNL